MLENLRKYGPIAMGRIYASGRVSRRVAASDVLDGWAKRFGLPEAVIGPAFELTCYWAEHAEDAIDRYVPIPMWPWFHRLNIQVWV
jgi:hypothetical protein